MPAYCVEAAAQHVITDPHTLQGFGGSGRRGSRLGLQAWELWTAPSMRLTRASRGEVVRGHASALQWFCRDELRGDLKHRSQGP